MQDRQCAETAKSKRLALPCGVKGTWSALVVELPLQVAGDGLATGLEMGTEPNLENIQISTRKNHKTQDTLQPLGSN